MPYTEINGSILRPHERYEPIDGYPNKVVIVHHPSYLTQADQLVTDFSSDISLEADFPGIHGKEDRRFLLVNNREPVLVMDAGMGTIETQTTIVKTAMHAGGGVEFINIGAAGGVDRQLNIGNIYLTDKAVRDCGTTTFIASPDEIAIADVQLAQKLWDTIHSDDFYTALLSQNLFISRGDSWSVPSMYYPRQRMIQLEEDGWNLKGVEMEDAAALAYSDWLNHNYGPNGLGAANIRWQKPIRTTAIHYISDLLPRDESAWLDTLNDPAKAEGLVDSGIIANHFALLKGQLMYWAINALCNTAEQ